MNSLLNVVSSTGKDVSLYKLLRGIGDPMRSVSQPVPSAVAAMSLAERMVETTIPVIIAATSIRIEARLVETLHSFLIRFGVSMRFPVTVNTRKFATPAGVEFTNSVCASAECASCSAIRPGNLCS